jgi:hypothetical protein
MDSTESEVPPPSKYASSQSKENTIQLKKMAQAQKQLYKESRNSSSKSKLTTPPPTNQPKQTTDVVKDETSSVCNTTSDCVAGINQTIDRIGEKLKSDCDAMKTELNSKYHEFKMLVDERTENTTKDIGALKNEFESRFDVIHNSTEKQADIHLKIENAIEVAIKELYKKVHYIEQILFTNDDRNDPEVTATSVTSVTSTPQKDEVGAQKKEEVGKNVLAIKQKPSTSEKGALGSQKENDVIEAIVSSTFKPSNAVSVPNTSSPSPPKSTTIVNVDDSKPKIDNNLVVADSVQTAGSYSFNINYEI